MTIDAIMLYDKALEVAHECLFNGNRKGYDYNRINTALELLKPIMQNIYIQRLQCSADFRDDTLHEKGEE